MEFIPNIKPKPFWPRSSSKVQANPIPKSDQKFIAIFNGFSVEVLDKNIFQEIYSNGFYGKGSHSRSAPEVIVKKNNPTADIEFKNETLILDLEESFFLCWIVNVLEVQNLKNEIIRAPKLYEKFIEIKKNFIETFVSYLYLRSKNWIIKTGFKFGGDFLIYKKGMRFYHASFLVIVGRNISLKPYDVQGQHRVAETANKDILLLNVIYPENFKKSDFLDHYKEFRITEMIIKRFSFTQFSQSNRK